MSAKPIGSISAYIVAFSLKKPVSVCMLFVALTVIGLVSSLQLKQELIPDVFSSSTLSIRFFWPNAPAKEVLDNMTLPLEDELSTLKGLEQIRSFTWIGGGRIQLNFKAKVNESVAYREARDRVERARLLFPEGIESPRIYKQGSNNIPTLVYGVIVDDGIDDYVGLVERNILPTLERIDGVADIDIGAVKGKEVIIDINRQAIEAAGLNPVSVVRSLADDNFTLASGYAKSGDKQYLLRSMSKFIKLEDIENRLVSQNIRLKDIATIRHAMQDQRWSISVNAKRALTLNIHKEGGANTVEVARAINQAVSELEKKPQLQSVRLKKLFDQGEEIQSALSNLLDSGKYGSVLAFIVLFLFLVRARLTLVITLSIPLCLIAALSAMYFLKLTLNVFTLISLVICIGLLVDNAVVVAQNITRIYENNTLSRVDACIKGCSEVALAIFMATLTTIIVFLPISLIDGETKAILQQFSIPLTFALMASFLSALILIPLCVYVTLSKSPLSDWGVYTGTTQRINTAQNSVMNKLHSFYITALGFLLANRKLIVGIVIIVLGSMGVLSKKYIDVNLADSNQDNTVDIRFRSPKGTSFEQNALYFKEVERILKENKETLKIDDFLVFYMHHRGRVQAWISQETLQEQDAAQITQKIVDLLPEKVGYRLRYGQDTNNDKEQRSKATLELNGKNIEQLEALANALSEQYLAIDGVIGLQDLQDELPNELALVIDRDKAIASGVDSNDISQTVTNALRGRTLSTMLINDNRTNITIRYQEKDREKLSDIDTFRVKNTNDESLSIGALTQKKYVNSSRYIVRKNKQISYRVTFVLDPKKAKQAKKSIGVLRANTDLPEGVSFNREFESAQNKKVNQVVFMALLSVLLIYLLMGFLFESFLLPFSILCTLPLAVLGVQAGFLVTGLSVDMMSLVATILLLGIVVNNGIVIVDTIIRLRDEGADRKQAINTAVSMRLKPVIMTALTTIVGLIPLTFAPASSMGITYMSFGIALISGLLASTLLTLLIVPLFYSIFDDLGIRFAAFIKRNGFYLKQE